MSVYKIVVETAWNSPGSTGCPETRGRCAEHTKTYFIQASTPEFALAMARAAKGPQDDWFDIESVEHMNGDCVVIDATAFELDYRRVAGRE